MKVKKEAVFQFASPATTIELLDSNNFFEITDDISRKKLSNFWSTIDYDEISKRWFSSHDKASQLTMSGFRMSRLLTSIIYESLKLFFHNLLYVFSLFIKILNRNQIEPVNDKVRNLS